MRLVDQHTAQDYLRDQGRIGPRERVEVRELAGGVSNMVLLVRRAQYGGEHFVLKQARAQLRTRQPWFSSVERNWREAEVLETCTALLERAAARGAAPLARTPEILFVDRDNYLFAMTAAAEPTATWKERLLAGEVDRQVAEACGRLLGTLHAESWGDAGLRQRLGDTALFDQLRVDPYYRALVAVRADARPAIERLIGSLAEHPRSLVHADFSPKNLLISPDGLLMVDFETGHFGDPAFDLGFFLSHLVLKVFYAAPRDASYWELTEVFRAAYDKTLAARVPADEIAALWTRGVRNFAGCAWARLDGKSPVEYLTDETRRRQVRALCRAILRDDVADWPSVLAIGARELEETR